MVLGTTALIDIYVITFSQENQQIFLQGLLLVPEVFWTIAPHIEQYTLLPWKLDIEWLHYFKKPADL